MSQEYNKLPTIGDAHEQSHTYPNAHEHLAQVVKSHGLSDELAIRLVHKHFDLKDGELPLFRTVCVADVDAFVLSPVAATLVPANYAPLHYAIQDKKLVALEYTTDELKLAPRQLETQEYAAFREAFVAEADKLGVCHLYGLALLPKKEPPTGLTEGEINGYRATISLPKALFADIEGINKTIPNNWKVTGAGGIQPIFDCIVVQGHRHIVGIQSAQETPGKLGEVIREVIRVLN